jgi:hypothetical protein
MEPAGEEGGGGEEEEEGKGEICRESWTDRKRKVRVPRRKRDTYYPRSPGRDGFLFGVRGNAGGTSALKRQPMDGMRPRRFAPKDTRARRLTGSLGIFCAR